MAVRDDRSLASDSPYQNQPQGGQHPGHGYEHNPHPTQPRNEPRSSQHQVSEPYPSPYQSQPQKRPAPSSEPPLRTTGYNYGHNPPPIQPQVYQQADVPPPKHGNGYLEPRPNRAQVKEPYPSPYPSQPQVRPALSSEPPPRTTGYNYEHNPPPIQPQVCQQADVPPAKHGNGYPEPRPNRAQVKEPYPSPYPSQPQVRPSLSSEPPPRTAGYNKPNPPSIQPHVNQQADVPPPKHGNGYPEPPSNRDQVKEPYPSPYPSQPTVRPTPTSKPPLKTTGYGYGDNPPLIQPQVYQQADVPPPKHGNGYPEPPSNRDQVKEPYPSPYPSQPTVKPTPSSKPPLKTTGDGCGHNPPLIQPQVYQQADVPPPKRGNGYPEPPSNHDQVNEPYQPQRVPPYSDPPPRTTVHYKHDRPAIEPYVNQQAQPYQDPSTKRLGFPEPNMSRLNANKPKKVPSDAIPLAGGHGTRQGHPYERSSPTKGDERSPVSHSGGQKLHVNLNFNIDPYGGQALANGSSKADKGSDQSGSGCCDCCSIM